MLLGFCIVVVVILESRSPGSVVIKTEENDIYWNAPRRQTFQYDFYFYKQPTIQPVGPETSSGRRPYFFIVAFLFDCDITKRLWLH